MQTALIICRNPSGLSLSKKVKSDLPVVLASDDPQVQEAAKSLWGVSNVCFIEQMEPFWTVADEVKNLIKEIDEWLCSLDRNLPEEILMWGIHIEGGITNQRVQDSILLIRSYMALFSLFDVAEVHLIADPSARWEDRVLEVFVSSRGLSFRRYAISRTKLWGASIKSLLIPLAKVVYFLFYEFLLGGGRLWRKKTKINLNGAIIFQLRGSTRKHVDNVKYLMATLIKRGANPVGICWSAEGHIVRPTGHEQLLASGISAIPLEQFVTLADMVRSLIQSAVIGLKAWAKFNHLKTIKYKTVSLSPLLKESFWSFFVTNLPQRLRYATALRACFSGAKPVAVKPWGGADFFEGKYALRLLKRNKNAPLYFHYWLGAALPDWPYTDKSYIPDLFLAKSPFEADLAMQGYGIGAQRIHVVGQARYADLHAFLLKHAPEESRRLLQIRQGAKLYIGVDLSSALRGFLSHREQLELIHAVLCAAQTCPDLMIVFKPHPSGGIEYLLPFIFSHECKNVVVLEKTLRADHFLNAIDIVITKYSTLIFEAALMKRCAIAAIFDGEERYKVFGDLPYVIKSKNELEEILRRLSSNDVEFRKWKSEQIDRYEGLMDKFYCIEKSSASLAAETIMADLGKWHGKPK